MSYKQIKMPLVAAIVTLAFTIGSTAFTKVDQKADTYNFTYQLTTYDQADVVDPANWQTGSGNCDGGSNKACQIEVDAEYTHVDQLSGERVLNTSGTQLDIQTGESAAGDYFVQTTDGIESITNKD